MSIININELRQEIKNTSLVKSEHMVSLQVVNNNLFFQVRFERWQNPDLMFATINYNNKIDRTNFNADWNSKNNYQIKIKTKTILSITDMEVIKNGAKRIASDEFTDIEVKNIFNNLFN